MNLITTSGRPAARFGATPSRFSPTQDEHVDVLGLMQKLWNRKFVILCLTVALIIPAAAFILHLAPKYRAEAEVMVEDRKIHVVALPEVLTGHTLAEDTVLSEIQVVTSRDMAKAVIDKLNLRADPEFNLSLRPASELDKIRAQIMAPVRRLTSDHPRRRTAAESEAVAETSMVDGFLDKLTVAPAGRSRVMRIIFESESPVTAARVANTVAELYQETQVRAKVELAKQANKWLDGHLAELRQQAENSRLTIQQFREEHGLLQADKDVNLITQQAGEISRQLIGAQARLSEAESRLSYANKGTGRAGDVAIAEVVQSHEIQMLRQQEATQRAKLADLETRHGPKYPTVQQAEAELQDLHQSIARESEHIRQSLVTDVAREKANVAQLSGALEQTKHRLGQANEAEARLVTLDRELSANDNLYTLFLDRVKQTGLQQGVEQPDSQIISRADPPTQPFFPRKGMLLALAVLTSAVISTLTVLAFDRKNSTFRRIDQIYTALGTRSLGLLPMIRAKALGRRAVTLQLSEEQDMRSNYAEAVRSLHARLLLSPGPRPKVVMFASALPGEGKSTASMALAALVSRLGRRAILIDCDMRRPNVHHGFGLSREAGLSNYLQGAPRESVIRTVGPGLDVVTAGTADLHSADLLASERMKMLLDSCIADYDLTVIDSPPVLAAPDALVLAPRVDKTVFLVQWAKTSQAAAGSGIQLLTEAGADIAGTVLSIVNVAKLAMLDPGASYYKRVHRYCQTI